MARNLLLELYDALEQSDKKEAAKLYKALEKNGMPKTTVDILLEDIRKGKLVIKESNTCG